MSETEKKSLYDRGREQSFQLTDRDIEIIRFVHQFRFLTTEHIRDLVDHPSIQGLRKRLRYLFSAKYLDRPKSQMIIRKYGEQRSLVYALGNAGADLLADKYALDMPAIRWTEKNRRVKTLFIEHTLAIANFMVSLEMSIRNSNSIRLINRDEIIAASPAATQKLKEPFVWPTQVLWHDKIEAVSIVPDGVFGLEFLDRPAGKNKAYFFLEIDRGTMALVRREIRQTSFLRKLYSYADTYTRKLHTERFGFKQFRVLTVTSGPKRAANLRDVYVNNVQKMCPAALFLFTDKDAASCTDILSLKWLDGAGKAVSLNPS